MGRNIWRARMPNPADELIVLIDSSLSEPLRNPSGHILTDGGSGAGWTVIADTWQCCHCNSHQISIKGSGVRRGFCMKCMQRTCGSAACDPCYEFERKLDDYEKGILQVLG